MVGIQLRNGDYMDAGTVIGKKKVKLKGNFGVVHVVKTTTGEVVFNSREWAVIRR